MRKAGFKVRRASPDSGLASPNIGPNYVCRRVAGIGVWYVAAGVGIHTDFSATLRLCVRNTSEALTKISLAKAQSRKEKDCCKFQRSRVD